MKFDTLFQEGPLGISVSVERHMIVQVATDSQASKFGVQVGDLILQVGDHLGVDLQHQELMDYLRTGPRPLKIVFLRPPKVAADPALDYLNETAAAQESAVKKASKLVRKVLNTLATPSLDNQEANKEQDPSKKLKVVRVPCNPMCSFAPLLFLTLSFFLMQKSQDANVQSDRKSRSSLRLSMDLSDVNLTLGSSAYPMLTLAIEESEEALDQLRERAKRSRALQGELDASFGAILETAATQDQEIRNWNSSLAKELPRISQETAFLCQQSLYLQQALVEVEQRLQKLLIARSEKKHKEWEDQQTTSFANYKAAKEALLVEAERDRVLARGLWTLETEQESAGSEGGAVALSKPVLPPDLRAHPALRSHEKTLSLYRSLIVGLNGTSATIMHTWELAKLALLGLRRTRSETKDAQDSASAKGPTGGASAGGSGDAVHATSSGAAVGGGAGEAAPKSSGFGRFFSSLLASVKKTDATSAGPDSAAKSAPVAASRPAAASTSIPEGTQPDGPTVPGAASEAPSPLPSSEPATPEKAKTNEDAAGAGTPESAPDASANALATSPSEEAQPAETKAAAETPAKGSRLAALTSKYSGKRKMATKSDDATETA